MRENDFIGEHGSGYDVGLSPPKVFIVAGPNGWAKSTSAPGVLPEPAPYINADDIAKTLISHAATNRDM